MMDILEYIKMYGLATLDVLIVSFIIFNLYKMLVGTRAVPIVKGFAILGISYLIGRVLELNTFLWLFEKGFEVAAIALIVIFQDELRRIVTKLGEQFSINGKLNKTSWNNTCTIISDSVYNLSFKSIGALIVLVRNTGIHGINEKGLQLNANLSKELLESIFITSSPIHDGAVIINDGKITAASCFLPLTQRTDLNTIFGTRHRAALGLTEITDCLVIIVSEENKKVSIAYEGKLYYDVPKVQFDNMLSNIMYNNLYSKEKNEKKFIFRIKQKFINFISWFNR